MRAAWKRNLVKAVLANKPTQQAISIQKYVIDHMGPASTTTDGLPGAFLSIGGDVVQSVYPDHIEGLAAGQVVDVLIVNGAPRILGRFVGLPNI